jgi:polysaccharide pyruvyl transferase WcaK-like protein
MNIFCIRPKGFNIGNDVIHLGLNHFIKRAFGQNINVISLPATGKYENQRKSGLSAQTVYEINQFGDGVIVGGGNLYENGELEVDSTALSALEKPMMIFSVSRGKIYNQKLDFVDRTDVMPSEKIALINNRADISLSRDKATKEYIDSIGCNNILGGCPTLFINEILQHLVPITEANKTDALISIRTPSLMSIPVNYQYELRNQLVDMIELLKKKGYANVKFLCHDHRDIPFAASFAEMDYLYTEDVYAYLTYLRSTRLSVSFRLHSFIPCISYDVPAIKISYDQRAISMVDTLGMDEWNIDLLKQELLPAVEDRINRLGELKEIKQELCKSTWADLRNTMTYNSEKFARLVIDSKC